MSAKNLMVYGMVILSMLFWSMTYIWYKNVFTVLNPITVMTFRLGLSALFLLTFSKLIGKLQMPVKTDFFWFLALSFFQPFIYFLAESYGVSMVSATISAVIISTIPIFISIVAHVFLNNKMSKLNIIGIMLSFIGVLMVILGKTLHFNGSIKGVLLLFIAVLSTIGYSIIIVKLINKYNSFTIISWQNIIGALLFVPLFFIVDFEHFKQAEITQPIIINLIYLALLGSSAAYIFFTYAIKNLGVAKASLFSNLIPIFTAIFSYYMINEVLTGFKIIGIFIVILGLFMGQIKPKLSK